MDLQRLASEWPGMLTLPMSANLSPLSLEEVTAKNAFPFHLRITPPC
jgi:hypothetical protein